MPEPTDGKTPRQEADDAMFMLSMAGLIVLVVVIIVLVLVFFV